MRTPYQFWEIRWVICGLQPEDQARYKYLDQELDLASNLFTAYNARNPGSAPRLAAGIRRSKPALNMLVRT